MFGEERNPIQTGDCWLESSYRALDNGWADGDSSMSSMGTSLYTTSPSAAKKAYKHVPHRDRPAVVVARRNARERNRVQAVNGAFNQLRKMLPVVGNR